MNSKGGPAAAAITTTRRRRSTAAASTPLLPRPGIRLRLTLTYAALLAGGTAAVLWASWWLVGNHLARTLPDAARSSVLSSLATDYALAVAGTALIALGLGWLAAGHALAPLRKIARTAQRISQERLDARVRLQGPDDELHQLADAFDAMLDRVQGAVDAQRRFVANASHELRTPLTVIRTEAEVALDDRDASPEELREALRSAVETTERTEALLDGLLLLALSTQGARRDEAVDLRALAGRVLAAGRPEADAAGVHVRPDLRPAHVRGDAALLERLVANLVENAVRHGGAAGAPTVTVHNGGASAVVRVANGGDVIAPEQLRRLTTPFERLDRARGDGTGLGLSIVQAVAEAHGGSLALDAPARGGLVAEARLPAG